MLSYLFLSHRTTTLATILTHCQASGNWSNKHKQIPKKTLFIPGKNVKKHTNSVVVGKKWCFCTCFFPTALLMDQQNAIVSKSSKFFNTDKLTKLIIQNFSRFLIEQKVNILHKIDENDSLTPEISYFWKKIPDFWK
jgi:hypothetical protein